MLRRFLPSAFRLFVITVIATKIVDWWTEGWWFAGLDAADGTAYLPVYQKILALRCVAFLSGALTLGGILWLNVRIAWRIAQNSASPSMAPGVALSRSHELPPGDKRQLERFRAGIASGCIVAAASLAGWFTVQRWVYWYFLWRAPILGETDPLFHRDLGFYLFRLPALNLAWGFLFFAGLLAFLVSLGIYAYEEVLELGGRRSRVTLPAVRHLTMLGAVLLAWKALGYRLGTFNMLSGQTGDVSGAGYVDAHWRVPLLWGMTVVALAAGGVLAWCGWKGQIRRALAAPLMYLACSLLIGTGVPALVQRLVVEPNAQAYETPYLTTQLTGTRRAFGLGRVQAWPAPASGGLSHDALRAAAGGLPAWPPETLRSLLNNTQTQPFYHFAHIHLDRYRIGKEWRPVVVAARELPPEMVSNPTWSNLHLAWTSGSGLVMCDAARTDAAGRPLFYQSPSPSSNVVPGLPVLRRPEIIFGEFAYVDSPLRFVTPTAGGAPPLGFARIEGAPVWRAPYPVGNEYVVLNPGSGNAASGNATSGNALPYTGRGGLPVGPWWRRWLLAWRFRDPQLAIAPAVQPDSRIVWHRRIVERCRQIAPFVAFDPNAPYPVLTDAGRITWVLNGFFSSDAYPYSEAFRFGSDINYLRYSITATVDAYDGTMHFYVTDPGEPFARFYQELFPGLFHSLQEMPADVRHHLRPAPQLLALQARVWAKYHVETASALLSSAEEWDNTWPADGPRLADLSPAVAWSYACLPTPAAVGAPEDGGFYGIQPLTLPPSQANPNPTGNQQTPQRVTALLLAGTGTAANSGNTQLFEWRAPVPLTLPPIADAAPPALDDTKPLGHTLSLAPAGNDLVYVQGNSPDATAGGRGQLHVAGGFITEGDKLARLFDDDLQLVDVLPDLPTHAPPRPSTAPRDALTASPSRPAGTAKALQENRMAAARAQFQAMQEARRRGDWQGYGAAEQRLGTILGGDGH